MVETDTHKYLCEPKKRSEMGTEEVQAKARAAVEWCRHATAHELAHGGKPWTYVLIPHDAITADATLSGLVAQEYSRPVRERGGQEANLGRPRGRRKIAGAVNVAASDGNAGGAGKAKRRPRRE